MKEDIDGRHHFGDITQRVPPAGEPDPSVQPDIRGEVADTLGVILVSAQLTPADDEPRIRPLTCDLGRRPNEDVGTLPRIESGDEAHDWCLRVDPELGPDPGPADRWMKLIHIDPVRNRHDRGTQPVPRPKQLGDCERHRHDAASAASDDRGKHASQRHGTTRDLSNVPDMRAPDEQRRPHPVEGVERVGMDQLGTLATDQPGKPKHRGPEREAEAHLVRGSLIGLSCSIGTNRTGILAARRLATRGPSPGRTTTGR